MTQNLLIFGATGALGGAIHQKFIDLKWNVFTGIRSPSTLPNCFPLPITQEKLPDELKGVEFDAVIFAQGLNANGSVLTALRTELLELFEANVLFISDTTAALMHHNSIKAGGRIVILSSLWEQFTRQDKLAYTVSKAAVGGLVRSMATDLGRAKNILVNAILPGIIETLMSRQFLSPEQIVGVENATPGGKLATPIDVANAAFLFASPDNTAISGQSIFVDLSFSTTRVI